MSDKKIQEMGLNKKSFRYDVESSDEESSEQVYAFLPKIVKKNSMWVFEKKKIPKEEIIKEESDSDLNLSDLFGKPQKRVHRSYDQGAIYCHNHNIYRVEPSKKKHFWKNHDTKGRVFGLTSSINKNGETNFEEDSSSEYISECYVESVKPMQTRDENFIEWEENINFNEFLPNFYDEEVVEDSWPIKDVKPYLLDSDTEDICSKILIEDKQSFLFNNIGSWKAHNFVN